jgi:hypothetical protein
MITTTFMNRIHGHFLVLLFAAMGGLNTHALVYSDQDLLLIFRQDGYDDVEFDLGSISTLLSQPTGTTVALTNWDSSLLLSNFGPDLSHTHVILLASTSRSATNRTAWVTSAQTNFIPTDLSTVGWGQVWSKISGIGNGAAAFTSGNTTQNGVIPPTNLDSYTFISSNTGVQPGLTPSLGGTVSFVVEGNAPSDLAFFAISPSGASPKPAAEFTGTFHVSSSGGLSYTAGTAGVTPVPTQILSINNNNDGTVTLTFNTVSGVNYRLHYTSQLGSSPDSWSIGTGTVSGTGSVGSLTDTPGTSSRYYVIELY